MGQAHTSTNTNTTNINKNTSNTNPYGINSNVNAPKYEFVNNNPNTGNNSYNNQNTNIYSNQPNQNNQMQFQNKPKYKGIISSNDLKDVFKSYAIEGKYLNKERFNDTIERLFKNFDIPSMHYTYLSEKIYDLLDESEDGKISEEEFMIGMKNVLTDREIRTKCINLIYRE
jgi:hypothetical protein